MDYLSKFINYLQATKNLSVKTLKAYSSDLNQFFKYEQNIIHPDICGFISYMNSEIKLRDTSIRRKIITLKSFYNYLIDSEIIDIYPFEKLKIRFNRNGNCRKRYLLLKSVKYLNALKLRLLPFPLLRKKHISATPL